MTENVCNHCEGAIITSEPFRAPTETEKATYPFVGRYMPNVAVGECKTCKVPALAIEWAPTA